MVGVEYHAGRESHARVAVDRERAQEIRSSRLADGLADALLLERAPGGPPRQGLELGSSQLPLLQRIRALHRSIRAGSGTGASADVLQPVDGCSPLPGHRLFASRGGRSAL